MKSVNHKYLIRYVDDFSATMLGVHSYFLVMEYAEGKTLRSCSMNNPSPKNLLWASFTCCLKEFLHYITLGAMMIIKGIIHRDLKPENIIVNSNGGLKIIDYGISKVIDYTSITSTGDIMGSPVYMSPEQIIDSKHIDKRSDLYTLGVILYEMLTFKFPYEFHSLPELYEKIKSEHPIPLRRWIPLMNNKIENVILKLLDKPYKRFPNASLVAETLLSEEVKLTERVTI